MSTSPRPSARGGIAARKFNAQERTEADLYARGVLTPESGESLEIDAICCPYCNADVHPTKYTWHLENKHNITTVEWLTTDESVRLKECESVIERGIKTYIEVGEALLTIRDQRLYRAEYKTFAEYCVNRWQISKTHANRLIDASEVAGNLTPIGVIPANEAQARPLTGMEAEEQRIIWQIVEETAPGGNVTAAHVKTVADYFKTAISTGAFEDANGDQHSIKAVVYSGIEAQNFEKQQRAITHRNSGKQKSIDLTQFNRDELIRIQYHANALCKVFDGYDSALSLHMKLSDLANGVLALLKS